MCEYKSLRVAVMICAIVVNTHTHTNRWTCVKLKFHWDQFSRNFAVADVTGKSPTSYEEVGRVASLLQGSYEEADLSRWSGVSLTSS